VTSLEKSGLGQVQNTINTVVPLNRFKKALIDKSDVKPYQLVHSKIRVNQLSGTTVTINGDNVIKLSFYG